MFSTGKLSCMYLLQFMCIYLLVFIYLFIYMHLFTYISLVYINFVLLKTSTI